MKTNDRCQFYSTMKPGGLRGFSLAASHPQPADSQFYSTMKMNGKRGRSLQTARAMLEIKWDTVPLDFARKPLKTKKSAPQQVGHFFDDARSIVLSERSKPKGARSKSTAIVNQVSPCYCLATAVNEVVTYMDTPQFQKAEYGSAASQAACQLCKQPVGAAYYRVNGAVACEQCATRVKNATPASSHANFMRGLLYGIGGAIIGLVIYSTFTIATGIEIGFISLAVGYIVGKAVKMGSRGFGGTHYQIAAVLLTYAAVSMSAVPIAISYSAKHRAEAPSVRPAAPANPATSSPAAQSSNTGSEPDSSSENSSTAPRKSGLVLLLYLVYIGLASPFLELGQDPVHGAIGVIILLVGMRIAWQLTSMSDHAQIVGPFKNDSTAAPAAPPPSLG
jgi:hypothetical protein